MRARVVRTVVRERPLSDHNIQQEQMIWTEKRGHTLCDIDIGARETIGCEEIGVHVDTVLCARSATGVRPQILATIAEG